MAEYSTCSSVPPRKYAENTAVIYVSRARNLEGSVAMTVHLNNSVQKMNAHWIRLTKIHSLAGSIAVGWLQTLTLSKKEYC